LWFYLRLKDRIKFGVCVLFVGINLGVRSVMIGYHFAGFLNRFWKLLFEFGLVFELITFEVDQWLLEFGFGIMNFVVRSSLGIDDFVLSEYVEGWDIFEKKI